MIFQEFMYEGLVPEATQTNQFGNLLNNYFTLIVYKRYLISMQENCILYVMVETTVSY